MRDLLNNLDFKRGISPAAATTDNTAWVSQIFDMQGYGAAMFAMQLGAFADTDATFTALVEDGEAANLSDAVAVADEFLLGTEVLASFQFDDDNECRKIGYIGPKRYVRVTVTPANNSGNAFLAGTWIGLPLIRPAANPPA